MGAVVMLLRTQQRQHWRSWLALAALVALAGGFVIAAATTARRTAAAFPDFVARHGYDAIVYSARPLLPALKRIPQVAGVTPVPGPLNFPVRLRHLHQVDHVRLVRHVRDPAASLPRTVKLLAGRMPDQSDPARSARVLHAGARQGRAARVGDPGAHADARADQARQEQAQAVRRPAPQPAGGRPGGDGERVPLRNRGPLRPVRDQGLRGRGQPALRDAQHLLRPAQARRRGPAGVRRSAAAAWARFGADDLDIDAEAVQRGITPQAARLAGAGLPGRAGRSGRGGAGGGEAVHGGRGRPSDARGPGPGRPSVRGDRPGAGGGHRNGGRGRCCRARSSPVAADPGRRSAARGRRGGHPRARSGDHHARGDRRRARHRGSLGLARASATRGCAAGRPGCRSSQDSPSGPSPGQARLPRP